ncbi:pirin family protein [Flavihumibacter sp.]|uniref:pirin family protein n=1 Tax=Flavihumibacter sp. TaxID=1913981 RepID=UPI002FCC1AAC|nr:pirin family protein [Flavihumibacter sediminis]
MRSIKQIHRAVASPIGDLITFRALPTASVDYLDPFLFLNHHGPQVYKPNNRGLPFGPHPHRGMETVTFILDGDITHYDSGGHESVINAGGVQWMTAGRGLIHAEVSSRDFKRDGGPLEILQLWVNLPAKRKMTSPWYEGKQKEEIPEELYDNGKVRIQLVSGPVLEPETSMPALKENAQVPLQPAFASPGGITLQTWWMKPGAKLELDVPESHTIFFYVVRGGVNVNGAEVSARHLVEFNYGGRDLVVSNPDGETEAVVIFGHAEPLHEPVVSQGPFVMNTDEEIRQAYIDYQAGAFGDVPLIDSN